jgi:choline-glycine betaine transporter
MMDSKSFPVLIGAAAVAAVLVAFGAPLAALLPFAVVLACPLMMIFMMKGMAGRHSRGEDHTGHGCEHDPTRTAEPPVSHQR